MLKRNVILLLLGLAACGGIATDGSPAAGGTLGLDGDGNTIPATSPNESLVVSLSSNWQIEVARIGDNRFRISMRKRRFAAGGDGEATQLFYRQAERIVRENGYAGYTVLEFGQGVESTVPIAQRVSQGIIEVK